MEPISRSELVAVQYGPVFVSGAAANALHTALLPSDCTIVLFSVPFFRY
jgi:hypothetical protein